MIYIIKQVSLIVDVDLYWFYNCVFGPPLVKRAIMKQQEEMNNNKG